jgi:hypothetical protein
MANVGTRAITLLLLGANSDIHLVLRYTFGIFPTVECHARHQRAGRFAAEEIKIVEGSA